jgi:hypothetical protein
VFDLFFSVRLSLTSLCIQELIVAKGLQSTWDHVGDISAAITYLKEIKRKTAKVLGLPHQNQGHSDVDISHLIWRIVHKLKDEGLLTFTENRHGNIKVKPVPDLLEEGAKKLKSSTLAAFNKKFKDFVAGQPDAHGNEDHLDTEADTLPPVELLVDENDL